MLGTTVPLIVIVTAELVTDGVVAQTALLVKIQVTTSPLFNDEDVNDAEDLCEKAESAKLASQVDISEGKARKIAEDNYKGNGKITEVQLGNDEDDNGVSTIIYEIEFTETDGNQVDVKVDAMSGKYFGVDTKDDEVASADEEVNGKNRNVHALQMQLMSLLQQLIALLKA